MFSAFVEELRGIPLTEEPEFGIVWLEEVDGSVVHCEVDRGGKGR